MQRVKKLVLLAIAVVCEQPLPSVPWELLSRALSRAFVTQPHACWADGGTGTRAEHSQGHLLESSQGRTMPSSSCGWGN